MITLSPGILEGGFQLLEYIGRHPMTFSEIRDSFRKVIQVDGEVVLETVQGLQWVTADSEGIVSLTEPGENIQILSEYSLRLRRALLDYVECERPPWLQLAPSGRQKVIHFVEPEVQQIFREALVVEDTSESVFEFWADLSARARGQFDIRMAKIGYTGEVLTCKYEKDRTGREPRLMSLDSNEDGYDVLSVVNRSDSRGLRIEVKASTQGRNGRIHITRNEWETAMDQDTYVFHIWDLEREELAVAGSDDLLGHMPIEQGDGKWESTVISIKVFDHLFSRTSV